MIFLSQVISEFSWVTRQEELLTVNETVACFNFYQLLQEVSSDDKSLELRTCKQT